MGQDVFLELGASGLKGDATDAKHDGQIEVTSFGLSVNNRQDKVQTEGERKAFKAATIEGISISKKLDQSSWKLLQLSLETDAMEKPCKIHFCKPSGSLTTSRGLSKYMEFTLTNASIQNYTLNAGGGYPTESFTLQFKVLEWEQYDEGGTRIGGDKYERPVGKK